MKTIALFMLVGILSLGGEPCMGQQPVDSSAYASEPDSLDLRWYLGPYVGGFLINDSELDGVDMTTDASVLFGARLGYLFKPHWAIEGSYGYTKLNGTSEGFGDVDGRLHLYHLDLVYLAPDSAQAQILLSAGVGGMRYSYDEFERRGVLLQDTSWANELVLAFGVGLSVNVGERFAVRGDVRDHLQFCKAEAEPIDETHDFSHCPLDDKLLNNPEFSGGLVFRF